MYKKLVRAKVFSIVMAIICWLGAKIAIMFAEGISALNIFMPAVIRVPMMLFSNVSWWSGEQLHVYDYFPLAALAAALVVAAIIFAVIAYIAHTIENDN